MIDVVLQIGGELEVILLHNQKSHNHLLHEMEHLHKERNIKIENFIYVDQLGNNSSFELIVMVFR
jgi:hypothetical protein